MGFRENIVLYCREHIGCEYSYIPSGGIEGESYNCSYLTYCAYRFAGLKIPKWQGHQNGDGSQSDLVRWHDHWTDDPERLKAGDLVFFSRYGDPENTGHVGISLGGWRMIDSVPDGGVQERWLYDSFVGGGWPLRLTPEEYEREQREKLLEAVPMDCIISIPEKDVCVVLIGGQIHDLTEPDNIVALNKVWAACHDGKEMPWVEMTPDWYGRLVQALTAGLPKQLAEYNTKFKPRS